jgi:hypothetical protein
MALSAPSIRRFVRRALVDATDTASPDRAQLGTAFDTLCGSFRDRLLPLFGATAVNALFVRAVHLATAEFGWLAGVVPKTEDPCAVDRITALGGLEIGVLEEGLAAVLAHNIELLVVLVGEDLVLPLVQQAWGTVQVVDAAGTEGVQ